MPESSGGPHTIASMCRPARRPFCASTRAHRSSGPRPHWRQPRTDLLSHLLGHEAPGSAFAFLQDQGWASGLSAGERIDQRDVAAFSVRVDLTEEGEGRWREVGRAVFEHVRLLQRSAAPQEAVRLAELWGEMAAMRKVSFENSEPGAALATANSLARRARGI